MTALLLYSYCCRIYSSRRIAKACRERVDFMSIVALDAPDFRTISDFRKRHLKALGDLFKQILQLCEKAGLVKLGHVGHETAADRSTMPANTMGMVLVSLTSAATAGVVMPTISSGLSSTSSLANVVVSAVSPLLQRKSMWRLRPVVHPTSFRP